MQPLGMSIVDGLNTTVSWTTRGSTTSAGAVIVTSDEAGWQQTHDARAHYPPVRRHALYVTADRVGGDDGGATPFSVTVECQGGFSGAASPPEMSRVRFYLGEHSTSVGAALTVAFDRDSDEVARIGQRWMLRWRCSGVFRLGDDTEVRFGAGLLVDTYGMFHLDSPWVNPDDRARFGPGATGLVPNLAISSTLR